MNRHMLLLSSFLLFSHPVAAVEEIEPIEEVRLTTAEVRDVTVRDGIIYGRVVNKAKVPLQDVRLLVRHVWLWNDEYRPDQDMYSAAEYLPIDGIIRPGESVEFKYTPILPSTPQSGHFETKVTVAEFTAVPVTARR